MTSVKVQYLAQMAIFRGGFDLDAAEAVLDWPSTTTAERVTLLQEMKRSGELSVKLHAGRSHFDLVRRMPFPRGRRWRQLALRHIKHFASKALEYIQHSGPGADWFSINRENLRVAVARAHRLLLESATAEWFENSVPSPLGSRFFDRLLQLLDVTTETGVLDSVDEGEDLLADLRRLPSWGAQSDAFRQRVAVALARGFRRRGDLASAAEVFEKERYGPEVEEIPDLIGERALLALDGGYFRDAEILSKRFTESLERDPQTSLLARGNRQLAIFFLRCERWAEAKGALESALILEPGGASTLAGLSWALAGLSDTTSASEIARQAIAEAERSHRPGDRAVALAAQANAFCDLFRLEEAFDAAEDALDLCLDLSWLGRASHVTALLAAISLDLDDRDAAAQFLKEAREHRRMTETRSLDPFLAREMIRFEILQENWSTAEKLARDYVVLASDLGFPEGERLAWALLGTAQSHTDSEEALSSFGRAEWTDRPPSEHSHDRAATIYVGHADILSYTHSIAAGREKQADEALSQIGKRLAWAIGGNWNGTRAPNPGSAPVTRSAMVRRAVSSLIRALPRELRHTILLQALDPDDRALVLEGNGRLVRTPGGEWRDLKAHPAALLDMLISARGPISRDDLIERLWPGDAASYTSLCSRLYVHISTLRKAGLGDYLHRSDDGYELIVTGPVVRLPGADEEPNIMEMRG